ncbi:M48 family metallopeptidase [Pseudonocardia sp. TRM90224]|uniref:M48 family metallopeptidase n=1 Tax=Pseudonocardia sp. TRM90224 TaxID=2812678 RepID=UPI001E4CE8BC|nr:M48 family metallopeptidase [Pseudonocardia sp. TRM90224]
MTEATPVPRPSTRVRFPGISPRAYEHPADRGALAALRALPGIGAVLKTVAGMWSERAERLLVLASAVRVGPKQYPRLDELRNDCVATLDLDTTPEMFVVRSPLTNAYTIGIDRPFIVLTTGLVESLDDEGLRFVIGHEVGHVLSEHAVLRTLLYRLIRLQAAVTGIPIGSLGLRAVIAALMEWFRKAELTCDRAGLLCSQDPAAALRVAIFMAGGPCGNGLDIPTFLEQAKEYEEVDDIRDSILKLLSVEEMSHPFAVVRAAQLQRWAASEEYRAILAGTYQRRADDAPAATMMDDFRSAARSYRDSFSASTDPLVTVLNDVGTTVADAAGSIFDRFRGNGGNGGGNANGGDKKGDGADS